MAHWMNLGQNLKVNAKKFPHKVALMDHARSFTFPETNQRVNQLAHGLMGLGLTKGDKVAVLMDNCIEIVELYLATAKTGIVIVPINFRLVSREVKYIVNNSDAKVMFVEDQLAATVDPIKNELHQIPADHYVVVGDAREGYQPYDTFIVDAPIAEPLVTVNPQDTWILIYTSGTTGKPKGVIRSHESHIAFYVLNAVDFRFNEDDVCMNVMPLCHINTTFYSFIFTYIGGSVYIHPSQSFKPPEVLDIVEKKKISFISTISRTDLGP